ncbi:hypothetical protein RF150_25825, partial [Escherichia coli]|nr:hypothetical protein [Escherichia coli]
MGVYVDKEFRVKRKSSEAGRKSAFAHKVKNGGKNYQRNVQERINRKGASKEVVVKISGGAITRQDALDLYIPLKTPQITLRDRELHRSSLRIV